MLIALALLLLSALIILFEYRIRKPDEIIIHESAGILRQRKSRFYPRHFSLVISGKIHTSDLKIEAEAKGKIIIRLNLVVSFAASISHLQQLIRSGGWHTDCVARAGHELNKILQVSVKGITEKQEIEQLSAEEISISMQKKIGITIEELGLDIIALNVYSIDPADEKIIEAIQQRETARIIEETEKANQTSRILASEAKLTADEKIAKGEHELQMKRYKLQTAEAEQQAKLANQRTKEDLERRKLQLEFDRKELDLVKNNPELLMLTPQIARLAEASQNLPNARTVVNLTGQEGIQSSQLLSLFQVFLQNLVDSAGKQSGKKKKTES